MTDVNRLQKLAGLSPKRDLLAELKSSRDDLNDAHNKLIEQIRSGAKIDEGLFNSLLAAVKTAGQVTATGAKAAAAKAKKLAEPIKQLYLDNKARAELKELTKGLSSVITTFSKIEGEAKTILSRDPEVASEVKLFKDLLQKTLDSLSARLQVQTEGLFDEDIRDVMLEHGYIIAVTDETPVEKV